MLHRNTVPTRRTLGRAFRMQSSLYFDGSVPHDSESSARSRILALTEYLYRLQGR